MRRHPLLVLERRRESLQFRRGEAHCPCNLLPVRRRGGQLVDDLASVGLREPEQAGHIERGGEAGLSVVLVDRCGELFGCAFGIGIQIKRGRE